MAKKINKTTVTKGLVFVILPIAVTVVLFLIWRHYFYDNLFINKTILGKDMDLKYFVWDEFDSVASQIDKDAGVETYYKKGNWYITDSGRDNMQKSTVRMLDEARDIIERENNLQGKPKIYFTINSAYRTEGRNAEVGGATKSAHKRGFAVDIAWRNYSTEQKAIIKEALERVGFNRFGIANGFIHVDNDLTLPNPANWTY